MKGPSELIAKDEVLVHNEDLKTHHCGDNILIHNLIVRAGFTYVEAQGQ